MNVSVSASRRSPSLSSLARPRAECSDNQDVGMVTGRSDAPPGEDITLGCDVQLPVQTPLTRLSALTGGVPVVAALPCSLGGFQMP